MTSNLSEKKCIPCESGNTELLLDKSKINELIARVKDWKLSEDSKSIFKEYKFSDFVKSISFINQVADVAEMEGHHPDIFISYNKVTLTLSTHSIGGLSENDFILASKINDLWLIK